MGCLAVHTSSLTGAFSWLQTAGNNANHSRLHFITCFSPNRKYVLQDTNRGTNSLVEAMNGMIKNAFLLSMFKRLPDSCTLLVDRLRYGFTVYASWLLATMGLGCV